jgi:cytochrome P450
MVGMANLHDQPTAVPAGAAAAAEERHGDGPDDEGRITLAQLDADPYPAYRALRDAGVVWVQALNRWMVTRWDDVAAVETARQDFSADETASNLTRVIGHQMLRTDGEAHRRLRSAAQDPLRPQSVADRRPAFDRIANELIDSFAHRGSVELVREFAAPFSALCLAEVLGLRDVRAGDIERWSQAIMTGSSNYGDDPAAWAVARRATDEIDAAVATALGGDGPVAGSIIAALAAAEGDGRPLSEEEISSNVKVMIGGGFNEPRDAIGTALWGLLTDERQREALLADPAWYPRVIDEAVRWVAPIGVAPREVIRPVTLGGTVLRPGARVMVNFAAANRDERQWERPDAFDMRRPKRRNVGFGVGHHFCLGVWMAREQVGAVALPALLRRLGELTIDLDRPPVIRGWVFRGPTEMWLRWET